MVALKEPDTGEVKFFIARALPFGASAAVHGFNRAAMALNHLVHEYIGVPCTHYFDDFTIIVPKVLASTVDLMTKRFFEILGWEVKSAKDKPMDEEFAALGVEVALHEALGEDPKITVKNKEDRVKELCKKIKEYLDNETMTPAEASEIRGKLIFSNSQTYGRMGALAYHHLGKKAHKSSGNFHVDEELRWALQWWVEHIENAKPRIVRTG